jgi:hypothetical protein
MADIDVVRKPGSGVMGGQSTWLWMLLAVLTVAALLVWLSIQSERVTGLAVVQDTEGAPATTAPAGGVAAGETVELAALGAAPDTYVGEQVEVARVPVASALGPRAFWGDIPGANPFLVVLGPVIQNVPQLASGQTMRVSGTVAPVTEELVDQWVNEGVVNAGARDEAGFATHYLQASSVTPQ